MITKAFILGKFYTITDLYYHEFNIEETTSDILPGEVLFFRENSMKCWLFTNKKYTNIKRDKNLLAEEGSTVLLFVDGAIPENISPFPFLSVNVKQCSFPTDEEVTNYLRMTYGI